LPRRHRKTRAGAATSYGAENGSGWPALRGIAHDFNNLLRHYRYSQVLSAAWQANPLLFEHAEEIEKASQRAVSLTRQLLAFSRQQVLEPVILNLNTLFRYGKDASAPYREDVALELELDPALAQVTATTAKSNR